jgi:LAS superfamily LD-carboxypeptidase LdcB/putative cell wall-binding protein
MRVGRIGIAVAIVATLLVSTAAPAIAAEPIVSRVSGSTQYSIAIAASKAQFPQPGDARVAVIVNGTNAIGGAIAAAAASALGGPLLLTKETSLPSGVKTELSRLAPSKIIIVGSTSSVSAKVQAQLAAIQPVVERYSTARYATAETLARLSFPEGASHAYVVNGSAPAATVSVAALAASQGAALFYVRATDTSVSASLLSTLADLGVASATIVGTSATVSTRFQTALAASGRTVDRINSVDQYAVSLAAARRFASAEQVLVASGTAPVTALAAIGIAGREHAPLVLTRPYCATAGVRSFTTSTTELTLVGDNRVVRDLVGERFACLSTTSASSIWVVANKKNKLNPASYVPSSLRVPSIQRTGSQQLRSGVATALEKMVAAAKSEGAGRIGIASGYRSFATQKALYARYVRTNGQAWADSQSARAGFSEHQTGLAADLVACTANSCGSIYSIASTAQGKWLAKNAYRFGFVLRYPNGRTSTTGYAYEPWHFRYVGEDLSRDYKASGFATLEGYFGYSAAPNY